MAERLALKRLAASDLSFFQYHFANETYGRNRQKGINLNTDVFVDQFYPHAHALMGANWPVLTTFYGPGLAVAYSPPGNRRPITYNNGKNWRLDGGTIPDDPGVPGRFNDLAPGDLALFRFRGDPAPNEVDVLLISVSADPAAHAVLNLMIPGAGNRSMIPVTAAQLAATLVPIGLGQDHPLSSVREDEEFEAEVEDVALGGSPTPALRRRRGGRRFTPEELAAAREEAQRIGADGEIILNGWLEERATVGEIADLDWVSQRDAAAPYDFLYNDPASGAVRLDAKSTAGQFVRPIHMSAAEVHEAAHSLAGPYAIARVYEIDDDGARLRIAEDISKFAERLLAAVNLPIGVRIDGFSIDPGTLEFGPEIDLRRPLDPEEE